MYVRDLMTETVVTTDSRASLRQAATQMLRHGVGSVIVTHGGAPAGIVTKSDILYAGVASGRSFDRIPLRTVVSRPVVTVKPDAPIERAIEVMKENSTKHLPVTDGDELRGIVTTTDIATRRGEFSEEMRAIRREPQPVPDDVAPSDTVSAEGELGVGLPDVE